MIGVSEATVSRMRGGGYQLQGGIIGKLLGHTQASTTSRYAHLDNDPLRRAANQIGGELAAGLGEPVTPRDAGNVVTLNRK